MSYGRGDDSAINLKLFQPLVDPLSLTNQLLSLETYFRYHFVFEEDSPWPQMTSSHLKLPEIASEILILPQLNRWEITITRDIYQPYILT